ncbi:MAG: preprotein translocase subunit YajC [Treponema sp.]|nr:preprotein translocase subunit YajC [Treponema sp.]
MNDFVFHLLMAPPPQGGEGGAGAGIMTFLPFIAIIAIFYFLIIRPQSKKQKETQKMLSTLKKGDKIVTVGGIYGTIQNVREHSIVVKVDDNTRIEFSRSAVSSIVSPGKEKEDKNEEKEIEDSDSKSEDGGDDEK